MHRPRMAMNPTKPVWQIAIEEMLKEGDVRISRSHFGLLDTIGRLATHTKMPAMHPLNRHQAVLNALEKSSRFTKSHVRLDRLSRVFTPTAKALAEVQILALKAGELLTPTPLTGP